MANPEKSPNSSGGNYYVKKVTLPSGKIMEVVHFDEAEHQALLELKADLNKMETEIDKFADALQADDILPMDF